MENIQSRLRSLGNEETRKSTARFVPGSKNVHGVKMPVLNELASEFKTAGIPLAKKLWDSGGFEEQILAAKIVGKHAKKEPDVAIQFIQDRAGSIDNWALCDTLGMQSLKPIFPKYKDEIVKLSRKLLKSDNEFDKRLSLVLLEWYTRDESMHPQIRQHITALEGDTRYYVKKTVEWIKRNLEKKR